MSPYTPATSTGTCKYTNGHNGKATPGHHNTVQYHALFIQQLKVPANYTPHQIHLRKPSGLSVLHERSSLTHHGLYWHNNYSNTLTTYTTYWRNLRELQKHIKVTLPSTMHYQYHLRTLYISTDIYVPTSLLQMNILDWCGNAGSCQQIEVYEVLNIDIYHTEISQHTMTYKQVFRHNTWCNQCNWNIRGPVQNMSEGQWKFCIMNTHFCTCPHTCVSALYAKNKDSIQKDFPTDKEGQQHQYTDIHSSKCLGLLPMNSQQYLLESHSSTLKRHPELLPLWTPIHILQLQPAYSTTSQHDLCPYPCLYSWNPLHLTQEDDPQYIDLNDIFKFPEVISASEDNVPSLDILGL